MHASECVTSAMKTGRRGWTGRVGVCPGTWNKKLIRRSDSERELSLRRYRTRTTKYNRLVHKVPPQIDAVMC